MPWSRVCKQGRRTGHRSIGTPPAPPALDYCPEREIRLKFSMSALLVALMHPPLRAHQRLGNAHSNSGTLPLHTEPDRDYCLRHRGNSAANEDKRHNQESSSRHIT
ncbi:protein of unknown function [Cupriavidus taiwanensis]|nr:protein of unknown function [Cupriavidus taiwanensis]